MKIALHKLMMLVLVLLCTGVSFSQSKKEKKADKDFAVYAYIDAQEVYIEVAKNKPSAHVYRNIAETYYWNSKYNKAAEWYERLITEYQSEATAIDYFRASQALKSSKNDNDTEMSVQYFEKYLAMDPEAKPRPPAQKLDYVAEVEILNDFVNTEYSDFGPTYYGDKLVYASAAKKSEGVKLHAWNEQPYLDLFEAELDDNGMPTFSAPLDTKLINTSFHESSAVFTKDGQTVYFTRNNFTEGKKGKGKKKTIRLKLYKATKSGENSWTNEVDLKKVSDETKESTGLNNDNWSVAHPALSTNEKYIYFSSDMPLDMSLVGDKTILEHDEVRSDLWMAKILPNNKFGDVKKLDLLNTKNRESFPFVSEANNLYFSSDGRAGEGGYDIYVVKLDTVSGMPVGEVKNLGKPANSADDDFGFIINEEKRIGYLSSNRANPQDGSIGDDIYLYKECEITIVGKATDVDTGLPLVGATVDLIDDLGETVHTVTSGADGTYAFKGYAACDADYRLRVTKKDCQTDENVFHTPSKTETITENVALYCPKEPICEKCDIKCILDIDRIHFAFDWYDIRDTISWVKKHRKTGKYYRTTNADELAKLLGALTRYENLELSIESHTDSRGSHAYNEWLSAQRAIATKKWLVDRGVAPHRLCAQAFGETELELPCPDGVECTEEEHDKNRRSEYGMIITPKGERCDNRSQRVPCIVETNTMTWSQWKRRNR